MLRFIALSVAQRIAVLFAYLVIRNRQRHVPRNPLTWLPGLLCICLSMSLCAWLKSDALNGSFQCLVISLHARGCFP